MDDSEYDDSDVEEIQLFSRAVSASPVSGIQRLPGTNTLRSAETNSVCNTEKKSDILSNHEIESQRSTVSDIQPGDCHEGGLDVCDKEKVAMETKTEDVSELKKDSESVSFGKRLLENEDESLLTCKRQKLLEQTEIVKEETETSFQVESGTEAEDENCDTKLKVHKDTVINNNPDRKIKKDKSPIDNTEFPPIAIVSPLPEKIPSRSNSPDNFADKLDVKGFTEEESAVISKLADYDPSMIDNSPSALDDMFKSIFPDKQDTFQTLDGNKWTFSDLQQNETAISPEQVNEKSEDNSCNMTSENDNLGPISDSRNEVQVCPIVKEEAECEVSDANHDGTMVKDFFASQSADQNLCDIVEPKKETLTEHKSKESTLLKAERKLLDCGVQEKSLLGVSGKNYLNFSVSTEIIVPRRSVTVPRRSGYEGLLKTGPPNCNIADFARQDFMGSAGDKIPCTVQNHPAIHSLLTDQNFHSKSVPTMSTGQPIISQTSHAWQGLNNERFPFNNTANSHHTERISNMNMQGYQPTHRLATFPRQPSNVPSTSAIQMHHRGSNYQLPGSNSNSYHTSMPKMNIPRSGSTIQNNAPINQSTYQHSYLPQTHSGTSSVDNNWISSGHQVPATFTTNKNINQPVLSQDQSFQNYPAGQKVLTDQGFRQPFSLCNASLTQNNQFQYSGLVAQSATVNPQQQSVSVRPTLKQYPYSSNSGIVGQPNSVNLQGYPPRHSFSLSMLQGQGGHQSFPSPVQNRNSAEQQQNKGFQNTPLKQLQNLTNSAPWQENMRANNSSLLSSLQNPSHDSFSAGNTSFPQANQSLITLKEKLIEVINLAKVIPSQEVKGKIQGFLLRAKSAKQSNLNDHDKQAFVEETRKFILEVTDLIYKTNKGMWRSNLYNNTQTIPNPNTAQGHMPMSSPNSGDMGGFYNSGLFMQQNQAEHIQTQNQSPSVSNSNTNSGNLHQNFDINGVVGNREESYNDINPLERFVM